MPTPAKPIYTLMCPKAKHPSMLSSAKLGGLSIIPDGDLIWFSLHIQMKSVKNPKKQVPARNHLMLMHYDLDEIVATEADNMTTEEAKKLYGPEMAQRAKDMLAIKMMEELPENMEW